MYRFIDRRLERIEREVESGKAAQARRRKRRVKRLCRSYLRMAFVLAIALWPLAKMDPEKESNYRVAVKPGLMLNEFKVEQRKTWPFWRQLKDSKGEPLRFQTFEAAKAEIGLQVRVWKSVNRDHKDDWVVVDYDPNPGAQVKLVIPSSSEPPWYLTNSVSIGSMIVGTNAAIYGFTFTNAYVTNVIFTNGIAVACGDPNCEICRPEVKAESKVKTEMVL